MKSSCSCEVVNNEIKISKKTRPLNPIKKNKYDRIICSLYFLYKMYVRKDDMLPMPIDIRDKIRAALFMILFYHWLKTDKSLAVLVND